MARATAPSPRTKVRRRAGRGSYGRATINAILDEGLVGHAAFVADGQPYAIPMLYARDGDVLYLHGSPLSRLVSGLAEGVPMCFTVTLLDGLVLARSAFHHSVNYRSVVVLGHGHGDARSRGQARGAAARSSSTSQRAAPTTPAARAIGELKATEVDARCRSTRPRRRSAPAGRSTRPRTTSCRSGPGELPLAHGRRRAADRRPLLAAESRTTSPTTTAPMHSPLHRFLAQARVDDLQPRRRARPHSRARPWLAPRRPLDSPVTLRFAFPDDSVALARLAALDSSVPPAQPVLLAEIAGELRAALSLSDGGTVSDPFFPSAAVVELLRARALQLAAADRGRVARVYVVGWQDGSGCAPPAGADTAIRASPGAVVARADGGRRPDGGRPPAAWATSRGRPCDPPSGSETACYRRRFAATRAEAVEPRPCCSTRAWLIGRDAR